MKKIFLLSLTLFSTCQSIILGGDGCDGGPNVLCRDEELMTKCEVYDMCQEWRREQNKILNVVCNSSQSCEDGQTCCMMIDKKWGCCPLPSAVCCPDKIHCCPNGYQCGANNQCQKKDRSIQAMKKLPSKEKFQDNRCDSRSSCPGTETCCRLRSGRFGCCRLPQAVCCSDGEHCCPNGYRCNTADNTCVKFYQHLNFNRTTKAAKTSPFCDQCREIVAIIEKKAKDPNVNKYVKQQINGICEAMNAIIGKYWPDFSKTCVQQLDQTWEELKNILIAEGPELCKDLFLCDKEEMLEYIFEGVKNKDYLLETQKGIVFRQKFVQFLREDVWPKLLNEVLPIENDNTYPSMDDFVGVLPYHTKREVDTLDDDVKEVIGLIIQSLWLPNKHPYCGVCEIIVRYADEYLKQNHTKVQIEQELDEVCTLLGDLSQKCKEYVDTYLPQILDLLSKFPPELVCEQMQLCLSDEEQKQILVENILKLLV